MKSICSFGALAVLAWMNAGGLAGAQSGSYGSPSLLPLPETRPPVNAQPPAGYRSASAAPLSTSDYGPSLASNQPEPISSPDPASSASPSDMLGPGSGVNPWKNGSNNSAYGNGSILNDSGSGGCAGGQCNPGGCMSCIPCCNNRWFGSVGGLIMTRNNPNSFWTTYRTNNNVLQLMNTKEAGHDWVGGGQVTFGRWWCCCGTGYGLQFVYWQLGDMDGYTNLTSANNTLSTPINLGGVNVLTGAGPFPAGNFFDNSAEHRIWRNDRFLNFEVNLLHQQIYSVPNRASVTCLAGFRYFRFQETLTFGAVASGFQFGQNGGADEAYLQSRVTNNLFGAQIGFLGNYAISPTCGVFALPKIGVFGNDIIGRNQLYSGDHFTTFDIHAQKTALSLMAELDLGSYWWLTPNCQVFGGWRVLGVSQVALGDNQYLPYLADSAGFGQIKSNGDLILTGAFAGVAFTF